MSNMTKIIGAAALGLGVAVAIPVLGHGFGAGQHGPYGDGPRAGHHMGMHQGQMHNGPMHNGSMYKGQMHFGGDVEERLETLEESLNLSTEQLPVWERYEQSVELMIEGHPRWGDSSDDGQAHFEQMEQHFTQMKAVFESRKALYETLTEQQKETIDNYMPGPFGHHYNGKG